MGVQEIRSVTEGDAHRRFMRNVLADLEALDQMIRTGLIESDVRRIGAEQEMVLVGKDLLPAPVGVEVLDAIDDHRVTTEIARFNLEINCDPIVFRDECLSEMHAQVDQVLGNVGDIAQRFGARLLLTGICPTLSLSHLTRENVSPRERYFALDDALRAQRGEDFEIRIKGADELTIRHHSVMLEALNTSFQVHYQIKPEEFASKYNLALATAAPILAACANSPALFGKRLWNETRIAIFQQVVDTRPDMPHGRDMHSRVRFGDDWAKESVLDIFRDDVARFRLLLAADHEEDSLAELNAGRIPKLRALQAFNSTVYRWVRPCYGLGDGKPHLRIENRILPAGPTTLDEMANSALWLGLMHAGTDAFQNIPERIDFLCARGNFTAAAREGLACHLTWLDGEEIPIGELVLERLLPVAHDGLTRAGVSGTDIQRYLGVIEERVASRQTGSNWTLRSSARMRKAVSRNERLRTLTDAMLRNQEVGSPVHTWDLAGFDQSRDWRLRFGVVSDFMSTDLFTVSKNECIDLVASIMDGENVRHVPVEDERQRLIGLVSYRTLIHLLAQRRGGGIDEPIAVADIMDHEPLTIAPETPTLKALEMLRATRASCLPVVENGRLVGIVTERDVLDISREILVRLLNEGGDDAPAEKA
jgi:CBS domain-containing protein